jgi:hypothetical protein
MGTDFDLTNEFTVTDEETGKTVVDTYWKLGDHLWSKYDEQW